MLDELEILKVEQNEIERQITIESIHNPLPTIDQIKKFMLRLKNGDVNNLIYKKSLINTFVSRIYLYDDKMVIVYNLQDNHSEVLFNIELVEASLDILLAFEKRDLYSDESESLDIKSRKKAIYEEYDDDDLS